MPNLRWLWKHSGIRKFHICLTNFVWGWALCKSCYCCGRLMGRFYPPVRVARSNIFQLTGAWFCIVASVQNDDVRTVGIAGWPGLSLLSAVMPEGGTMFGVVSWHQLKIRRSLRPQHNTNVPRSSNRITRTRQWMVDRGMRCKRLGRSGHYQANPLIGHSMGTVYVVPWEEGL